MRTMIFLASLVFFAVAATADESTQAPRVEVGQVAPAISLPDSGGETQALEKLRREKNVILIFSRGSW